MLTLDIQLQTIHLSALKEERDLALGLTITGMATAYMQVKSLMDKAFQDKQLFGNV
jgi:hypothetical protein